MMTHEGTWRPSTKSVPHLEFSVRLLTPHVIFFFGGGILEEGRIPHSFHRRLRMTLEWMCTVYCSVDILLLVTLRMVLNQTHQRGFKAAKFTTSE